MIKLLRFVLLCLLYCWVSCLVMYCIFLRASNHDQLTEKSFDTCSYTELVTGQSREPFVYRKLVPFTIQAIAWLTPSHVKVRITEHLNQNSFLKKMHWQTNHGYEVLLAFILIGCLLFFLCFVYRYSFKRIYRFPQWFADMAPAVGLMLTPLFIMDHHAKIYDIATLFCMALSIPLIYLRRHTAFYLVFIVACINRETAVLLTVLFISREIKLMNLPILFRHGLIQLSIWIVIRTGIVTCFKISTGSPFAMPLLDIGRYLSMNPTHTIYFCFLAMMFTVTVLHSWHNNPLFCRIGFLAVGIPFLAANVIFAILTEMRTYFEIVPFLVLFTTRTFVDVFGIPVSNCNLYTAKLST